MEFVRRGVTVVQLRRSTPTWTTATFLETACGGGMSLTLDDWPLVDNGPAFFRSAAEPCPLADGGFSIRMFDRLPRRGVCDAYRDQTRLESRCSADEDDRIHFRFRYSECVPEALGMEVDQPAFCLASWSDDDDGAGVFAYTLLRHHRTHRTWCLRYPAAAVRRKSTSSPLHRRRSFTGHLFRDAFCDHGRTDLSTERYVMIDFVPSGDRGNESSAEAEKGLAAATEDDPGNGSSSAAEDGLVDGLASSSSATAAEEGALASSSSSAAEAGLTSSEADDRLVDGHQLCRDDYEACDYWRQPCRHAGSAQMLACARRCGICNDDRPAACQLPQHLRGQWTSKLTPSHQQLDSASASDVVITQHFVQVGKHTLQ